MKRIVAILLLCITVISLVGCNGILDVFGDPTKNPEARYNYSFSIKSYDGLITAWNILKANDGVEDGTKYYSFGDSIGQFETVYYFTKPAAWKAPTCDAEEYFSNVQNPTFQSLLFYTSGERCSCSDSSRHSRFVELPQEYYEMEKYPVVVLEPYGEVMDIDNPSLLILKESYDIRGFEYVYYYGDSQAFTLTSCRALSEPELEEIKNAIFVLE